MSNDKKIKMSDMMTDKAKEIYNQNRNQKIKDYIDTFDTPQGKRVLEDIEQSVYNDCSEPLNPYAVMRKDAVLHLIKVYIPTKLKQKEK